MSRDQRIAAAIRSLCDAAGVSTDWQRKEIEGILGKWIDNEPTIEAEHAKDDRMYWVQVKGIGGKRRGWRASTDKYPWFVEGFTANFSDGAITVLGEVERDDIPGHPEVLTTVEDFENAPEWTVIARDHLGPFVKFGGIWRNTLGEVISNELLFYRRDGGSIPVLRLGGAK